MNALARVGAVAGRRPVATAAVLYAVLALLFVGPGLLPGRVLSNSDSFWFQPPWGASKPTTLVRPANPEVDDAPAVLFPFLRFNRSRLPDVPLWNPYIQSGRPYLADAQSAIFSPFSVAAYVTPSFFDSLALVAGLKLFLAAFGMFLLARSLGLRLPGALVGGLVYGFNLWFVTWLVYPHSSVWALIPWLLFLTDRVLRAPGPLPAAGLGALVGMQFLAGHPESSFHAMLATVVFFGLRLLYLRRRDPAVPVGPRLVWFGGALAVGGGLAAVVLIPFLELLARSADITQRQGSAIGAFLAPRYLLGGALYDYWGKPTKSPLELFLLARAVYAGALPLMLAVYGLVVSPRPWRWLVAALSAACMCVVFGIAPIYDAIVHLPPFSSGHNGRLVVLYMLGLALLAGWGLDTLLASGAVARWRRRLGVGLAVAIAVIPLLYVLITNFSDLGHLGDAILVGLDLRDPPSPIRPEAGAIVRLGSAATWTLAAALGLAFIVAVSRSTRIRRAVVPCVIAAILIVALDLFKAGMGYNPAIDASVASQPVTPAIRELQRGRPDRFVGIGAIPQDAISMDFRLFEARGYDLPIDKRYDHLWRTWMSPEFPSQVGPYPLNIPLSLPRVTVTRLRVLSTLGVRQILQPVSDPVLRQRGLTITHDGPDARVYANAAVVPRAHLVAAQQVIPDDDRLLRRIGAPSFDAASVALTERTVPGIPRVGPGGRPAGAGGARILDDPDPDRVSVVSTATRPALLVLSDLDYPGWKATVDGRPAPISRVNYAFRGVRVPTGRHRVEFRYEPASVRIGAGISLVALFVLLGLTAVGIVRARQNRRRS